MRNFPGNKKKFEFDPVEVGVLQEALDAFNWDSPDLTGDERQFYLTTLRALKKAISEAL